MTRLRIVLAAVAATALLSIAVGSVASAHEIGRGTAEKVMRKVAKKLCEDDPQCVKFNDSQFFCDRHKRGSHVHKVVCTATTVRRTETGERVVCKTEVTLTTRRGQNPTDPTVTIGETKCS